MAANLSGNRVRCKEWKQVTIVTVANKITKQPSTMLAPAS